MVDHPALKNLAEDMDDDDLAALGKDVSEAVREDDESRNDWLKMHAKWVRLYYQQDKAVNPPWAGASEESLPLLAEACNQFHARAFQAMFPNRNLIKAIPTGEAKSDDRDRAERVGKHMSWQVFVKDRKYKKNKDRLLLSVPLHGSCFTKAFYDPLRKMNVTENVRAEDLVVPYGVGPRDIDDIERKTHIISISKEKTAYLHKKKFFIDEAGAWEGGENRPTQAAQDNASGHRESGTGNKLYSRIYEHHCLRDFDDDGIAEPYIVWVDASNDSVLRVAARWEMDSSGNPVDDKRPIEYFTHYTFLENPDGFYGLGMGHLIGEINTAVNKLLRQSVDAGTLANTGNMSGMISKQLSFQKGEVELQLGKFIATESNVDDLSKGIYQFRFPGPQPVLQSVIELLMGRSDRLATVTEALTGQADKVMQPTTIMALIEQGLQVFSTVYERVLGSWADELQKLYDLNRQFLDGSEYFTVLEVDGALTGGEIHKSDYANDLQIIPLADPKMTTEQQKYTRAEAEWQFIAQNPLVQQSPQHFYNASKRYLEAIGTQGIDEILPKPNPIPPVDNPFQENMMALMPMPQLPDPAPEQDHIAHMEAHSQLLNDPQYGAQLSDSGRAMMEEHVQKTIAMMYQATEGGMDGQGIAGGMADAGGDAMGLQDIVGAISPAEGMGGGDIMGLVKQAQGAKGGT